jgi:hypothetical protein
MPLGFAHSPDTRPLLRADPTFVCIQCDAPSHPYIYRECPRYDEEYQTFYLHRAVSFIRRWSPQNIQSRDIPSWTGGHKFLQSARFYSHAHICILTYLWTWTLLHKLPSTSQHFKEPESLSPCSQESYTGPYPEPDRSSPYNPILSLYGAFASGQHVGFVVDKAALGQVFSLYCGFPCQSFHQFLHHHNHLAQ